MIHSTKHTRLTDALERELMAREIEAQMQFRPVKELKTLLNRLFSRAHSNRQPTAAKAKHATS